MVETKHCPRCGSELAADAPAGLCPKCLLSPAALAVPASAKMAATIGPPPTADTISVKCMNGHKLRVPAKFAGRRAKCPQCQAVVVIPSARPDAETINYHRGEADDTNLKTQADPGKGNPEVVQTRPAAGQPNSQPDEAGPLADGQKLGRFELLAILGEGAFGRVFRARDPHLQREVAIKVPRAGLFHSTADRERFLREARAAATVQHPNVCPIYEIGETKSATYLVMGLVEGRPLSEVIHADKLPSPRAAATFVRKLALALDAAHQKGVVHRDLKPANIVIDRQGEPIVMDFGLARRTQVDDLALTQAGDLLGTPAYMSPEQARGQTAEVGTASDIYSLGVIFYELLCGHRPFEGGSLLDTLSHIANDDPKPPSAVCPTVDRHLEAVCLKAMAKRSVDRFGSMADFAAALSGGPESANDLVVPSRRSGGSRRRVAIAVAAAAAFLLIAALGVVFYVQTDQGTLKIEAAADDVEVIVSQGGQQVAVLDKTTGSELRLHSGAYEVALKGNRNDVKLSTGRVELTRGSESIVTITKLPPATPAVAADGKTPPAVSSAKSPRLSTPTSGSTLSNRAPSSTTAVFWNFTWEDVPGATKYHLNVRNLSQPEPLFDFDNLSSSSFRRGIEETIAVSNGWTWKVRAFVNGEWTAWSQERNFYVNVPSSTRSGISGVAGSSGTGGSAVRTSEPITIPAPPNNGPPSITEGSPMSRAALVQHPAKLPGLLSWTVETVGHRGRILEARFSPDDKLIATCGVDGTVRLWDAATAAQRRVFIGHDGYARGVAWSPDSRRLASVGDTSLRIWEIATGRCLWVARPTPHEPVVLSRTKPSSVDWSPDGKQLAIIDDKGYVTLWDAATWKQDSEFQVATRTNKTSRLVWSPDGSQLAIGTEKSAVVYDVRNRKVAKTLSFANSKSLQVAWSSAGQRFAVLEQETVHIYDTSTSATSVLLTAPINAQAPGIWPHVLATLEGTDLSKVPARPRPFSLSSYRLTGGFPHTDGAEQSAFAAVSADGKSYLASSLPDLPRARTDRLAESPRRVEIVRHTLQEWDYTIPSMAWSPDKQYLAASHKRSGRIDLWNIAQLARERRLGTDDARLDWSPDGKLMAAAREGAVELFDTSNWSVKTELPLKTVKDTVKAMDGSLSISLAWADQGTRLATYSAPTCALEFWDAQGGKLIGRAATNLSGDPGAYRDIQLSRLPSNRGVANVWYQKPVGYWDLQARSIAVPFAMPSLVNEMAFSPDGQWVVHDLDSAENGVIRLRSATTGQIVAEYYNHRSAGTGGYQNSGTMGLAWLADSERFASIGSDQQLNLWNRSGTKLDASQGLPHVAGFSFSSDGQWLALGNDVDIALYRLPSLEREATLVTLRKDGALAVTADGNWKGTFEPGDLIYAAVTSDGVHQTFTAEEFAAKFGWKNDPAKVQLRPDIPLTPPARPASPVAKNQPAPFNPPSSIAPSAEAYRRLAAEADAVLKKDVLDKWFPAAVDRQGGGFFENFSETWARAAGNNRSVVYQANLTWMSAKAAQRFPDQAAEYLEATRHGVAFLADKQWDKDKGGFFNWVDASGRPDDASREKSVFWTATAMGAAATSYAVTHDAAALDLAKRAFAWLDQHAHDATNGGYIEQLTNDGLPMLTGATTLPTVGKWGCKTISGHLQLLNTLTQLYAVWPDPAVKARLQEVFDIVRNKIYTEPGYLTLNLNFDWSKLAGRDSYGHDLMAVCLLADAAATLGQAGDESTLTIERRLVDHALQYGWDRERGGFYSEGEPNGAALVTAKTVWMQAAGLKALLLMHERYGKETPRYWDAFVQHWNFITKFQIDQTYGGFYTKVTAAGARNSTAKSDNWNAGSAQAGALLDMSAKLGKWAEGK